MSNNIISDVRLPEAGYSLVNVSGNNFDLLDVTAASGTTLIIGYIPSFDYSTVSGNFKNYKLVNIPSDMQDTIREQISAGNVIFSSSEEDMNNQNQYFNK